MITKSKCMDFAKNFEFLADIIYGWIKKYEKDNRVEVASLNESFVSELAATYGDEEVEDGLTGEEVYDRWCDGDIGDEEADDYDEEHGEDYWNNKYGN